MLPLFLRYALALVLAAAPALWLLRRFWLLDKKRPEPLVLVGKGLLYGFLAVLPAVLAAKLLGLLIPAPPGLGGILFKAFVLAAFVEEATKLLFIRSLLFRRPEFDERADGVVYAVCVSLGFAVVENFLLGYDNYQVLLLRSVTAVPLHAISAGLMGVWLGRARLEARNAREARAMVRAGLVLAVLVHGLYDAVILAGLPLGLLVLPILLGGWRLLDRLYREAREADARDPRVPAEGDAGERPGR
jgi:RsiW-degrading membrane proteinase PrsW (M82 family)